MLLDRDACNAALFVSLLLFLYSHVFPLHSVFVRFFVIASAHFRALSVAVFVGEASGFIEV